VERDGERNIQAYREVVRDGPTGKRASEMHGKIKAGIQTRERKREKERNRKRQIN
jgi:hypothetical protein